MAAAAAELVLGGVALHARHRALLVTVAASAVVAAVVVLVVRAAVMLRVEIQILSRFGLTLIGIFFGSGRMKQSVPSGQVKTETK